MDELPLDDQTACANDAALPVAHNEQVVLVAPGANPLVPTVPLLLVDVADSRQHTEDVEVASLVIGATQRADGVVCGKDGKDIGGDERGGEEGGVLICDGSVDGLGDRGCSRRRSNGCVGHFGIDPVGNGAIEYR